MALEIPRDLSVELDADRIPPAQLAGLAVDRTPLDLSAALADAATASDCCASRSSERAGSPFSQSRWTKRKAAAAWSRRMTIYVTGRLIAALATYISLLMKTASVLLSLLKD